MSPRITAENAVVLKRDLSRTRILGTEKNRVVAMVSLEGRCEKLVMHGMDFTRNCGTKILNTNYSDSRSGFYFVTTDGAALTFSGIGNQQVKPHPERAIQPIDLLIFGYKGQHDKHAQS
jgi:hypothetical protein